MADHQDDARRTDRVTRRGLLGGGATLGGAAVAAATVSGTADADEADRQDDPRRLHYRETDHIRAFYRRSRI